MLTLGEFSLDNFADHPQTGLCYMVFLSATFISSVTMLNMLIAIMGDSFGRVMENRHLNSVRMKLTIMGEQEHVFKSTTKLSDEESYFMYLVTLDDHEPDEMSSWEGSIKRMT